MRNTIEKHLRKNHPELAEGSIRTYVSILTSLYNKMEFTEGIEAFTDYKDEIIEYINSLEKPQTRKTILSGLVKFATDVDEYHKLIAENSLLTHEHYRSQQVEKQKLLRMKPFSDILGIYEIHKTRLLKEQTKENYMDLLICVLFTGVVKDLPPRRLLDYYSMKKTNYDPETENYTDGNVFVFNQYKTAKKDGRQTFMIPASIKPLIKHVMSYEGDYLLSYAENKPYTQPLLSNKLKKMFGISIDGLRSIYLSNLYKGLPKLKEMDETASKMGHSVKTALSFYVKPELQEMNY